MRLARGENKKRLPPRGKLSAKRTDEGRPDVGARERAIPAVPPLIRLCGATFPPRGKAGMAAGTKPLPRKNQSNKFVMLFKLTPSVDALCSRAEVAGAKTPIAPSPIRVPLKLMIKR